MLYPLWRQIPCVATLKDGEENMKFIHSIENDKRRMKHSAYDICIDGRVVELREGVKNNFRRMFINVKGEFHSSDIGWQQC